MDLQDLQVLLVPQVMLVHHNQVHLLELQDQQVHQDQQVLQVQVEVQEQADHQDLQVQQVLTVLQM